MIRLEGISGYLRNKGVLLRHGRIRTTPPSLLTHSCNRRPDSVFGSESLLVKEEGYVEFMVDAEMKKTDLLLPVRGRFVDRVLSLFSSYPQGMCFIT